MNTYTVTADVGIEGSEELLTNLQDAAGNHGAVDAVFYLYGEVGLGAVFQIDAPDHRAAVDKGLEVLQALLGEQGIEPDPVGYYSIELED